MELIRPVYCSGKQNRRPMREFQERKTHIAIVADEYGGRASLPSRTSWRKSWGNADEFDAEEIAWLTLDERTFIIEAKTALIDVYRILSIPDEPWEAAKGESDTLGGFITEQAGRFCATVKA